MDPLTVAVIGTGNVGGTLGRRFAQAGHEVLFGARNPSDAGLAELVRNAGPHARALGVKDAAQRAAVVVLATPWDAARNALASAGDLSGKALLDCTNPLAADLSGLLIGHTTSGAEQIASWAAGARVVKIFNTTGFGNMENPRYPDGPAAMLYCGDDAAAKADAARLAADIGFEPIDAGPLAQARLLEPFALLWISLAYQQRLGREFAFRLVRR